MSDETGGGEPLLRTIAELRTDVNRLIDEQLARLSSLAEKRIAEPIAERRFNPPQAAYQPVSRPPRAPVAARAPEPEKVPDPENSSDPGLRLDALARHLDGRLRRTKAGDGAASERQPRTSSDSPATTSEARS